MIPDKLHRILENWYDSVRIEARELYRAFSDTFGIPPDRIEAEENGMVAVASLSEEYIKKYQKLYDLVYTIAKTYCRNIKTIREVVLKAKEIELLSNKWWTVTCYWYKTSCYITRRKVENHIEYMITIVGDVRP